MCANTHTDTNLPRAGFNPTPSAAQPVPAARLVQLLPPFRALKELHPAFGPGDRFFDAVAFAAPPHAVEMVVFFVVVVVSLILVVAVAPRFVIAAAGAVFGSEPLLVSMSLSSSSSLSCPVLGTLRICFEGLRFLFSHPRTLSPRSLAASFGFSKSKQAEAESRAEGSRKRQPLITVRNVSPKRGAMMFSTWCRDKRLTFQKKNIS